MGSSGLHLCSAVYFIAELWSPWLMYLHSTTLAKRRLFCDFWLLGVFSVDGEQWWFGVKKKYSGYKKTGSSSCRSFLSHTIIYLIRWSHCCGSWGELNFHQNPTSIQVPYGDARLDWHSVLNSHYCEINKEAQRHELRKGDQPWFSWCNSLHHHRRDSVWHAQCAAAARPSDRHLLRFFTRHLTTA